MRSELRRLGYLSPRFDRYLLQDALRPQAPVATLAILAAKVGLLSGILLAAVAAVGLAAANGSLRATPFDVLPLFLHLAVPSSGLAALAFLALAALLVAALRLLPGLRIERLALAGAVLAASAATAPALWRLREVLALAPPGQLAALALALPPVVYAVVRLLHGGLLALAIRLTERAPERRIFSRRWVGLVVGAGVPVLVLVLLLPAALAALAAGADRAGGREWAPGLPTAPGERVLLVGVDGVLAQELEYLLARGELPALRRRLAAGGALLGYRRPPGPPAAFWTTVATGLPAPEHGVGALDGYRPVGVSTPLARSGFLRVYWREVAMPLGLAEHRPILSNRRRAWTVWELAARRGAPVAVVDWWTTYPAESHERMSGLVVAHGAYQLLGEGAPAVVAPPGRAPEVVRARESVTPGPLSALLAASVGSEAAARLLAQAILPDRFYREVFAAALGREPAAACLYLPGLDIAAEGWTGGRVAFGDLVRFELAEVDALLARFAGDFGTVAVVFDPGRREGSEGRAMLWRRDGCTGGGTIGPGAIAAGLLRALGLPQSEELPPPPAACPWPEPPATVPGYGARAPAGAPPRADEEYLESLRALGYL